MNISRAFPRMYVKTLNRYSYKSTIDLYGIHCKKVNHWFHSPRKRATENVVIQKADLCACLIMVRLVPTVHQLIFVLNSWGEHGICQNNPHDLICLCENGFIHD